MQTGPRNTSMALAVLVALLAVLLLLPPLQAQTASLVADLATERDSDGIVLWGPVIPVQDKIFFVADEPTTGTELWVSDGTTHGTRVLSDLCSDRCGPTNFEILGALDEALLFTVQDSSAYILWRSDGTREGTFALAEINRVDLAPNSAFFDGFLYFRNCTGRKGCELWRSDGTLQGTGLFEDFEPVRGSGNPWSLTVCLGFSTTIRKEMAYWAT